MAPKKGRSVQLAMEEATSEVPGRRTVGGGEVGCSDGSGPQVAGEFPCPPVHQRPWGKHDGSGLVPSAASVETCTPTLQ